MDGMKNVSDMDLEELFACLIIDRVDRQLDDPHSDKFIPLFFSETEEEIYRRISFFKDGISNIELTSEKKRELYIWTRNNQRYSFLNELCSEFIGDLLYKDLTVNKDDTDIFLVSNILPIMKIIDKEMKRIIQNKTIVDLSNMSKVTKEKTIGYVKKILSEIDPSLEWLNMYNEMLNNNMILYYNEMSDSEIDNFLASIGLEKSDDIDNSHIIVGNDNYIFLNYKGNISDISNTIHEVIHYINRKKIKTDEFVHTLDEFFSIFYQLYALEYLDKLGYKKSETNNVRKVILYGNASIDMDSYLLFIKLRHYMKMFLMYGKVSEEKDIHHYRDNIKLAHVMCDTFTNDFMMNDEYILMKYRYIIGNYLAKYGINKIRGGENILPIMKYYVENTLEIDPYDIFTLVGVDTQELGIKKSDYSLLKKGKKLKKEK